MTSADIKKHVISKKTPISVGLVLVLCGCVWWASSANSAIQVSSKANDRQDVTLTKLSENQVRISTILDRVEGRINKGEKR